MSLLVFLHWLAKTHIGIAMRDWTWAFAIVEIVHLLALAVFGGAILFFDARLMNLGFKSQPASEVARELLPVTAVGTLILFVTGSLLLSSGPMRYYYNTPFRIKMCLLLIALVFHFVLQIKVAGRESEQGASGHGRRVAGAISLVLWASIGIAGRAIGYF